LKTEWNYGTINVIPIHFQSLKTCWYRQILLVDLSNNHNSNKVGNKNNTGIYYYHLVIEDNAGFLINNLQSERIDEQTFLKNFEELNN